ncbi:MAG TPA: hypothetical protein VIH27_01430 [Nitrososphaerales archaeon]
MKLDYRSIFVAPPGKLLVVTDLSQAESWVVAYLADERNMKYALHKSDIHCQTGGALYFQTGCDHHWVKETLSCTKCRVILTKDQRYLSKRRNHASSYGMGPDKAMRIINADSDKPPYISITLKESDEHHKNWHNFYNVKGWWAEVLGKDRIITTSYGRTRIFYDEWGDDLERKKIAFEPQSTVADHFSGMVHPLVRKKGGLIEIYRQLIKPYKDHKITNMSHDSCILELPKENARDIGLQAEELLRRPIIIKDEEFTIPTDGLIGDRWSEGEMEKLV